MSVSDAIQLASLIVVVACAIFIVAVQLYDGADRLLWWWEQRKQSKGPGEPQP